MEWVDCGDHADGVRSVQQGIGDAVDEFWTDQWFVPLDIDDVMVWREGAGGFGDRIVAGLAVNDHALMLAGAIPAAILALLAQALLTPKRKGMKD